jgi:hypothetical protein
MFILLERDKAAVSTIRHWVHTRLSLGLNQPDDSQIQEALKLALKIEVLQVPREKWVKV